MRTTRSLTISPSMVCSGGMPGPGGCLLLGGLPAPGGCLLPGGVVFQHALRQTPPPREQNSWHTPMKILPCPLRLRTVINRCSKSLKISKENVLTCNDEKHLNCLYKNSETWWKSSWQQYKAYMRLKCNLPFHNYLNWQKSTNRQGIFGDEKPP